MMYFWIVAFVCVVFCIVATLIKNFSEKGVFNKKQKQIRKDGKKR